MPRPAPATNTPEDNSQMAKTMTYDRLQWTRSTKCASGTCLEVAVTPSGAVLVRDSKKPDQPPYTFTRDEWASFVNDVNAGLFKDL